MPDDTLSPDAQDALQTRIRSVVGSQMAPDPWAINPGSLMAEQQQEGASIADAEKSVAAAIRYQGLRLYQRDLATGLPADQALARNAPMMFWQPTTSASATGRGATSGMLPGMMTAAQSGNLDLARQRLELARQKATQPKAAPRLQTRYIPGVGVVGIDPTTGESTVLVSQPQTQTVTERTPPVAAQEAIPQKRVPTGLFGWGAGRVLPGVPAVAAQPGRTVVRRLPLAQQAAAPGATAQGFPPVPPKAQRKEGQTYRIAKGLFTWMGQGWLPFSSPAVGPEGESGADEDETDTGVSEE